MTRRNPQAAAHAPRDRTLAEALVDEMAERGHNQSDAASEMGVSTANMSRWLAAADPMIPDGKTAESLANIDRIVRYLRLPNRDAYAVLAFRSVVREMLRRERQARHED